MRLVALSVLLGACASARPAPRLLFAPPPSSDDPVQIDHAAIDAGTFQFELGGRTITPQLVVRTAKHGTVARGTFGTDGHIVVARVGNTVTGVVREGPIGFEIVPFGGGHRILPRTWQAPLRPLHRPGWNDVDALRGPRPAPVPVPVSTEPVVIDVLFAYTKKTLAARKLTGIQALVDTSVEQLNEACAKGGGKVTFRSAGLFETADGENNDNMYSIYYLLLHKKRFKDVHAKRKELRADIVMLLVDKPEGELGYGTIMGERDTAVAVADHNDTLWYITVPHEIGHVMGGLHDDDTRDEPFPYGHAYVGTNRTIMSNPCPVPKECPLLPLWSSPPGFGDANRRDNARVVRETAGAISKFGDQL